MRDMYDGIASEMGGGGNWELMGRVMRLYQYRLPCRGKNDIQANVS